MPIQLVPRPAEESTIDPIQAKALQALAMAGSLHVETNHRTKDKFQDQEVGLIHPRNASYARIRDNGNIELFASNGCGIEIGRNPEGVAISGATMELNSKTINIRVNPSGLSVNGYILNPNLYLFANGQYARNLRLQATVDLYDTSTGEWSTVETSIRPFVQRASDIGYYDNNLLKLVLDK